MSIKPMNPPNFKVLSMMIFDRAGGYEVSPGSMFVNKPFDQFKDEIEFWLRTAYELGKIDAQAEGMGE